MANGLMEFAEGFALTFGEGMAENIRKRGAEEDKYVRDQVALMRQRIANGKAKESQLKNEVRQRIELLQGQLKGFSDEDIKAAASNEFRFQEIQNLIQTDKGYGERDQDKVGKWYMSGKVDPYKPREDQVRTPGATLLSEIFVPVKLDPEKPVEEDNILRTLFGAPTDPAKLQRMAEDRVVSQRGMGALDSTGAADLERYYARGGTVRQPTAPGTGNIGRPLPKSAKPTLGSVSESFVADRAYAGNFVLNAIKDELSKAKVARDQASAGGPGEPADPPADVKQPAINRLRRVYRNLNNGEDLPANFLMVLKQYGLNTAAGLENHYIRVSRNRSLGKDRLEEFAPEMAKNKVVVAFLDSLDEARNTEPNIRKALEGRSKATGIVYPSPRGLPAAPQGQS